MINPVYTSNSTPVFLEWSCDVFQSMKVANLYNSIHRTCFLTEATVDAFGHVNVITGCPPAAISTCLCFYGDSLDKNIMGCQTKENINGDWYNLLDNITDFIFQYVYSILVFNIHHAGLIDWILKCHCTWAGQMASQSLQAMQRSSPEGYLRRHHVKHSENVRQISKNELQWTYLASKSLLDIMKQSQLLLETNENKWWKCNWKSKTIRRFFFSKGSFHRSPAQCVFSPEAWRQWTLLKRVIDGGRFSEEVAQCHAQT